MIRPIKLLCARTLTTISLKEENLGNEIFDSHWQTVLCFILILRVFIHYSVNFSTRLYTIFLLTTNNNHSFLTIWRFTFIHINSNQSRKCAVLNILLSNKSSYFVCVVCFICLTVAPCLPITAPTESLGTRILEWQWDLWWPSSARQSRIPEWIIIWLSVCVIHWFWFVKVKERKIRNTKNTITQNHSSIIEDNKINNIKINHQ